MQTTHYYLTHNKWHHISPGTDDAKRFSSNEGSMLLYICKGS
jgi:hypothetical protein